MEKKDMVETEVIPSDIKESENYRNVVSMQSCIEEKREPGYGVNRANLHPSTDPRVDFYDFACGGWLDSHPMPGEFSRYGVFTDMREKGRKQLEQLVMNLKDSPDAKVKDTVAQKVGDLYQLAFDIERRNSEGVEALLPDLERAMKVTHENLADTLAWMYRKGSGYAFVCCGTGPDVKDSDYFMLHVVEIGLGLGDRDYYLVDNEEHEKMRKAYLKYLHTILSLAGFSEEDTKRMVETYYAYEKEMAVHKKTREEQRDPTLRNNPMTIEDFCKKYNNFDWKRYFDAIGFAPQQKLNVSSVRFYDFMNGYLPTLTEQQLRDIIAIEIVLSSTGALTEDFEEAAFEFNKVVEGVTERMPRWKKALGAVNGVFGELIGQLYVERYFPESHKKAISELVENLRGALRQHIESLDWMSDATKQKALEKLSTFGVKLGYPDKWRDLSEIHIDPSRSYLENLACASEWFIKDGISKCGKPVDKDEWHMFPQTANAYYNPLQNEICFPAAILQPPYFDPEADAALNYGAIGVVIGHEMTHGFDDSGRKFDKNGNLNDWWTEEDTKNFEKLGDALVAQFDKVELAPGILANGRYTLGENIADQGGLRVAMTAYRNATKDQPSKIIDGFTPEQRFYLSYGSLWATHLRDEEILLSTKSDPHSLGPVRVNETLRNIAPFFEAFGIKDGDPMYRREEERVVIW